MNNRIGRRRRKRGIGATRRAETGTVEAEAVERAKTEERVRIETEKGRRRTRIVEGVGAETRVRTATGRNIKTDKLYV